MKITAHLVDLHRRRIYPAEVSVDAGRIAGIREIASLPADAAYLLPGFVDAHVHIESSMLPPAEFARLAVVHGTVATVSDPHEIANVLGLAGVEFMLDEARRSPFKFCFGAPSCVPATGFETAGSVLDARAIADLLQNPEIGYLSEVMNFPGVLQGDPDMLDKIAAARQLHKPVDGHAPGLRGENAKRYFAAGITTDHECFSYAEGLEKAQLGVKILIREGSAARNFEALWPLLQEFPAQVMFCSDDKHPDALIHGHINQLVIRALAKGCDLFDTLRAACLHPVAHYGLPVGLLRVGDAADFIQVNNLSDFQVLATWLDGQQVAENGKTLLPALSTTAPNQFVAQSKVPADFRLAAGNAGRVRVIQVLDGEIVTQSAWAQVAVTDGFLHAEPTLDLLKITVVNRYVPHAAPAIGFVRGFGIRQGALASSVAHDSHNIVAVGTDDLALCTAVNAVIAAQGGISAVDGQGNVQVLALPIAGLMSQLDGYTLAQAYAEMDAWTKESLGCTLQAPFMALSFLALPVIPALKMTDLGLFDVEKFAFTAVEA